MWFRQMLASLPEYSSLVRFPDEPPRQSTFQYHQRHQESGAVLLAFADPEEMFLRSASSEIQLL